MKKNIFQTLLVLAFLFISGFSLNEATACPPAINPVTGLNDNEWKSIELVYEYNAINGCHAQVRYTVCYRENKYSGLHEISIENIKLYFLSCPPDAIYDAQLRDELIINLMKNIDILKFLNLTNIPFCPASACLYKIYDIVCYSGWYSTTDGGLRMTTCTDQNLRSCNEAIYVCINPETKLPQVTRYGTATGPACPSGCHSNCE